MKLEIKKDKKNEMEFVVEGEDNAFSNLLVSELLKNDKVEIAQYNIPHPLIGQPTFYLRTKSGNALSVLKETVKSIKKDVKSLQ